MSPTSSTTHWRTHKKENAMTDHKAEHTPTEHAHGEGCGHKAVQHGDHVDYKHDGHLHAEHGDHYDEH